MIHKLMLYSSMKVINYQVASTILYLFIIFCPTIWFGMSFSKMCFNRQLQVLKKSLLIKLN